MQNKTDNQVNAGFFVRLAAYLIDSLIVGAALLVVRIPIWISSLGNPDNIIVRDFIFQYSIADIVTYILGVVYFVVLTYKTGATIGKRVLHLRVQSVEDRSMTFFEVAFRETVGRFLSALIINVGYFIIGAGRDKRGLHDILSDTEVIYYHEKKEYVETPVIVKTTSGEVAYTAASYVQPAESVTEEVVSDEVISDDIELEVENTISEESQESEI